jgi:hypothetical protein
MHKYLGLLLAVTLVGCGTRLVPPTAEEAMIIFIVPSMTSDSGQYQPTYGDAPTVSLHDVTGWERKIVAVLTIGNKVGYRVTPGKHEFMLANRYSTDFMEANVVGGKTYYAIVQRQGGVNYQQHYGFRPVRAADFENGSFGRWESNTRFVNRPGKWKMWDINNEKSLENRAREFRPAWDRRASDERALRTLEAADGR